MVGFYGLRGKVRGCLLDFSDGHLGQVNDLFDLFHTDLVMRRLVVFFDPVLSS